MLPDHRGLLDECDQLRLVTSSSHDSFPDGSSVHILFKLAYYNAILLGWKSLNEYHEVLNAFYHIAQVDIE